MAVLGQQALSADRCKGDDTMEGIQFLTNAKGKKVGVLIDLKKYGELWEDIYDALTARRRAHEPRESLESVRMRLRRLGKLNG